MTVSANDMVQRVEKAGTNAFTIRGVASNRGIVASELELKVGGKTLTFSQSGGMAPTDLARAIAKKLPKGFKATIEELPYKPGPGARAPVKVTITQTGAAGAAGGGGRLMSPTAFAQANVAKGRTITSLIVGNRGSAQDLLKNPALLAKHKVGEFAGSATLGGRLTNTVYRVRVPGPDDRPVERIIVRVGVVQPNDAIKWKFVDVGSMAKGGPRV